METVQWEQVQGHGSWRDWVTFGLYQREGDAATEGSWVSHNNPDGKGLVERLQESKVTFSAAAENIALGPRTGKEAYDGWLRSPEHRRNMLGCRYTRHGVGRVGGRWTHVLLSP